MKKKIFLNEMNMKSFTLDIIFLILYKKLSSGLEFLLCFINCRSIQKLKWVENERAE